MWRSWLPAAAITAGAARVPVAAAVAAWSAAWLAEGQVEAGAPAREPAPAGAGWRLPEGVSLTLSEGAAATLGTMMFGRPDDPAAPTAADRAAILAVVEASLADLRGRIAAAFGLPVAAAWRQGLPAGDTDPSCQGWAATTAGVPLFTVAAGEPLLARRILDGLPPASQPAPCAPFAAALAEQPVGVAAYAGRCRLTTAELAGLGAGDVIVLDRPLAAPLALAVEWVPQALPCTVETGADRLALTIA